MESQPLHLTDEEKAILRANNRKWHVTPGPPIITIFVRHATSCKYRGDEFYKSCHCRKHLRWSSGREQHRKTAGTRSWAAAEDKKRELEDQLSGRTPEVKPEQEHRETQACIDIFLQDKKNQGITEKVIGKYTRELARLREYCESKSVYTVQGITGNCSPAFALLGPTSTHPAQRGQRSASACAPSSATASRRNGFPVYLR